MFDDVIKKRNEEIEKIKTTSELAEYICSEIEWASERISEYRYKIRKIENDLLDLSRVILNKGLDTKTSLEDLKNQDKDVQDVLDLIHCLCNDLDDMDYFKDYHREIRNLLK